MLKTAFPMLLTTHSAHAFVATAFAVLGYFLDQKTAGQWFQYFSAASLIWYWSRETRDSERYIIRFRHARGLPASVWTIWPHAMVRAWTKKDLLYPATMVACLHILL